MKKAALTALALMILPAGTAMAQDMSYSYYGAQVPRAIPTDPADSYVLRQNAYQHQWRNMEPRGGRDPRGGFYGRPTVWPGDYKDALDRGSWPAGDRRINIAPRRQWPD